MKRIIHTGLARRRLSALLYILIFGGLFLARPLIMLCVTPLHIGDRAARDRAFHDGRRACLSPDPESHPQAVAQIFAARAWGIRGVVAEHTWIAFKPAHAHAYTVCEIRGWLLREQARSPLVMREGIPDRYWMGSPGRLVLDLRGPQAGRAIAGIMRAVQAYPYAHIYRLWPGPNSNTFTAYVVRSVPELRCVLPVTAIGRDFLPGGTLLTRTPSNSGYQISLLGLANISAARREGLELSLLGLSVRLDPTGRLYLPGGHEPVLRCPARNAEASPVMHDPCGSPHTP